jgi:hypothetical protein
MVQQNTLLVLHMQVIDPVPAPSQAKQGRGRPASTLIGAFSERCHKNSQRTTFSMRIAVST